MTEEQFETAFIVIKKADGTFFATTDLSTEATVNRTAEFDDIKLGCRDLVDRLTTAQIAGELFKLMQDSSES